MSHNKQPKGFTVLFAALIAGLLLAVGLAIFDIIFKEVSFAVVARDSNYAIYAADTGAECAQYWDQQCPAGTCKAGFTSAFATSTNSQSYPAYPTGTKLYCDGQDILTANQSVITDNGFQPLSPPTAQGATTTFSIYVNQNQALPCVIVQVGKNLRSDGSISTSILSYGFNTCVTNDPNRIERAFLISY